MEKITAALARLAEGEYGICRDCEQEIGGKRLRALPFAARCKECQESAETSARHQHRTLQRDASFRIGTITETMLTN